MPHLEVTVFNQKLKLSYLENEKERLVNAINILNESWKKFSNLHGKVSDVKIITLLTLELQDSIGDYKDKIKMQKNNIDILNTEIERKTKEFENSIDKVNKLKLDIGEKNSEISKINNILDEIYDELMQIKTNILVNKDE